MYYYDRVLHDYDPENDIGPDAPVSWAAGYLAQDMQALHQKVKALETQNESLTAAIANLQVRLAKVECGDPAA
jgi:hypothetical protein